MSAEMFATVVIARLRPVAGIEVESHRGLEFRLRVRGEPSLVHLDSFYQRYRAEPALLSALVEELTQHIQQARAEAAGPDSFEQVAPHLLPLLITTAEWQTRRDAGLRLVVRPLVQDLGIALVVDEPEGITYVQLEAIPYWGVDIVSTYETALNNLASLARLVPVAEIGSGVEKLLIDRGKDGYAATRAILPDRLEDWSRRIDGELVLGLPTRDWLIGMSIDHPNLDALAAQVEKDARSSEHGLLPQLLVYRNGALELLPRERET